MKKIVLLFLVMLLSSVYFNPAYAGILAERKLCAGKNQSIKSDYNAIKNMFALQNKYAKIYDIDGVAKFYSKDFVSVDGFNKELYIKLIKDTWKTYPDVTYTTKIKDIVLNNNYAVVYTDETAIATSSDVIEDVLMPGELYAVSKNVYNLEKIGQQWFIISENILEETSALKYGDTRYTNFRLNSPKSVGFGKYYTVSLEVDAPKDAIVVASINKESVVYPQTEHKNSFRRLEDVNTIERVFLSNTENLNEFAIATVGIVMPSNYKQKIGKIYRGGFAFIMKRINVIPENKFIEDENGKNK